MITHAEFFEWMSKPLGIHPDSLAGRLGMGLVLKREAETFYVCWCCRNECGGVWRVTNNRWTLTTPIPFDDFLDLLDQEGILEAATRDDFGVRRWIKACRLASCSALQEGHPHAES